LNVKQAKENYELSYGRYRVGEGSPIELKDAQLNYQQAQLQYYRALYEYNASRAGLEKAVGKNIVNQEEVIDLDG
jgi:outer membrane protein TolC